MGSQKGALRFLNPQQVIESGLSDLKIAPQGETVVASALRDVFVADLGRWESFEQDISNFYSQPDLQDAFRYCENVDADIDLLHTSKTFPHFAALEHTQIGDERDLHGRFLANVTDRVLSTIKFITDPQHVPATHVEAVRNIPLSNDINIGSAKIVPKESRLKHEPDIVVKIPGWGEEQRVRVVGELKFPGTCDMHHKWGDVESQTTGSMHHKFGQVARDMREAGVRFGFVSTYKDTVFLKIIEQEDGPQAIQYSEPIPHTQEVVRGGGEDPLTKISVRLAIMYLLFRASHDEGTWSVEPCGPSNEWTIENPNNKLGLEASPYDSSFKMRGRLERLDITAETPTTPTNTGNDSKSLYDSLNDEDSDTDIIPQFTIAQVLAGMGGSRPKTPDRNVLSAAPTWLSSRIHEPLEQQRPGSNSGESGTRGGPNTRAMSRGGTRAQQRSDQEGI